MANSNVSAMRPLILLFLGTVRNSHTGVVYCMHLVLVSVTSAVVVGGGVDDADDVTDDDPDDDGAVTQSSSSSPPAQSM